MAQRLALLQEVGCGLDSRPETFQCLSLHVFPVSAANNKYRFALFLKGQIWKRDHQTIQTIVWFYLKKIENQIVRQF